MNDNIVDLRSDTVTKPTAGMRAAMAAADVGDDFYREDPEVNALQTEVAELFGHEAALFMPSGWMANQVAVQVLVDHGAELICDADAYIVMYQSGSAAAIGGISTRTWPSRGGELDTELIASLIHQDGYFAVPTRAIAVENTHNRGGGAVLSLDSLHKLRALADDAGLAVHCDGARIWHAHIAEKVPLIEYGKLFDTMTVCLSKGLGAPVGSMVISSAENIERARLMRKQLGGGMRQVGVLAAAGRYAIVHHLDRLTEDHARARRIAKALADYGVVDLAKVQTNMVFIELAKTTLTAAELTAAAGEQGVLLVPVAPRTVRAVTHLDVDDVATDKAIKVLTSIIGPA